MSSVHSQRTGSDSGARAQPTTSDEIPRPEPGEMSQEGTGKGPGNTMTGDEVTRVDEMPIEVQQEVYVLPAATHRMARVVQQEFPTYETARVVSGKRRSRSRSRIRGQPNMARVYSSSRSGSRSRSRSRDVPETSARVISRSRRSRSRSRSKNRSRQRGKRHCIKLRTRRRGMGRMARDVDGVTAPGSGEKGPWSKLFGYREYSSLLATDSDFLVFKRFGASNARVLLALQDDVMQKERDLAEVENALRQSTGPEKEKIHVARLDYQADNAVWKLHESLDRYNKFLIQVAEIGKWPTAEKVNIQSLKTWHSHHPGAIDREETTYLLHTADLFRLLPRNAEPLRKFLERWDRFTFMSFWRKEPDLDLPVAKRQEVLYMEDEKIDNFVLFVTVVIWLAMIIVPLWVLYFVHPPVDKLAVITAFIVVFLAVMALVTDAKPSEMLGATAGYAALIVVFLSFAPASSG